MFPFPNEKIHTLKSAGHDLGTGCGSDHFFSDPTHPVSALISHFPPHSQKLTRLAKWPVEGKQQNSVQMKSKVK